MTSARFVAANVGVYTDCSEIDDECGTKCIIIIVAAFIAFFLFALFQVKPLDCFVYSKGFVKSFISIYKYF